MSAILGSHRVVKVMEWLQKQKETAQREADEYARQSNREQKDCCEHRAVAYQRTIDYLTNGK